MWRVGMDFEVTVEGDGHEARRDRRHGLRDRKRADVQIERARFETRQLEEIADQAGHRADDRATPLEELALDRGISHPALEDEVEIPGQSRERRSELMGDGRDEPLTL